MRSSFSCPRGEVLFFVEICGTSLADAVLPQRYLFVRIEANYTRPRPSELGRSGSVLRTSVNRARGGRYLGRLIVNGIIGVVLLFLTNLFLGDDLPINVLTVLICAIVAVVALANHGHLTRQPPLRRRVA